MFEIQDTGSNNALLTYLKSQSPEAIELAAKDVSPEIRQIINHNIQGLVGMLPPQQFQVSITTTHENLANLIGSAMMTGYFLSQMETRMKLDSAFGNSFSLSNPDQFNQVSQVNELKDIEKPSAE